MKEYVFVYNANSGIGNALVDYGKKYIAPDNYDCELCMVTYGPFGMKKDWKQFIKSMDAPVRFLHKDEYESEFSVLKTSYPAMLVTDERDSKVLFSRADFENVKNLDDLKELVKRCCSSATTSA